jgi:hypothetical protein
LAVVPQPTDSEMAMRFANAEGAAAYFQTQYEGKLKAM